MGGIDPHKHINAPFWLYIFADHLQVLPSRAFPETAFGIW